MSLQNLQDIRKNMQKELKKNKWREAQLSLVIEPESTTTMEITTWAKYPMENTTAMEYTLPKIREFMKENG